MLRYSLGLKHITRKSDYGYDASSPLPALSVPTRNIMIAQLKHAEVIEKDAQINAHSWHSGFENLKNISVPSLAKKYHANRTFRESFTLGQSLLQEGQPDWNFLRCFICFH